MHVTVLLVWRHEAARTILYLLGWSEEGNTLKLTGEDPAQLSEMAITLRKYEQLLHINMHTHT